MKAIRLLPLVALCVACTPDQPDPAVPWEADVDRIQAEEVVAIHGPDGVRPAGGPGAPDPAAEPGFGRIAGAALDAAGRIHILDAQAQMVFVFDPAGTHLHDLGGPGEGPGEFSNPNWLSVFGEEVSVRDRQGISTFRADGEWVDRRPPTDTRAIRMWRAGERGSIEAAIYGAGAQGIDPLMTFILADSDGVVDTLAVGQTGSLYFRTSRISTALNTPFCDVVHVAVGPEGRIFVADGERGTLTRYRWEETLEREEEWEVAPPGVAIREDRLEELLEPLPDEFRDSDEEFVGPPVDAHLCGVHAAGEERVWIRLDRMPDRAASGEAQEGISAHVDASPGELWRTLDAGNGEPILDVRFPSGVQISGFARDPSGGTRAIGVHADELGVESVRVYRIR